MAAGKLKHYNDFFLNALKAALTGVITARLYTSASNANTLSTTGALASLTNEVSSAGYPGARTLTSVTWTKSGAVTTFDSDAVVFSAAGSDVTARTIALSTSTTLNSVANPLIGVALLDVTPADVTVTDGNDLTINPNVSGWFTQTGATAD
jgi:hypothetical protein